MDLSLCIRTVTVRAVFVRSDFTQSRPLYGDTGPHVVRTPVHLSEALLAHDVYHMCVSSARAEHFRKQEKLESVEPPFVGFSRISDTCFGYISTEGRISNFRIVFG